MNRGQGGFTFLELVIVTAILMILASTIMPLTQVTQQRQREVELRRTLREMRTAIDKFSPSTWPRARIPPRNAVNMAGVRGVGVINPTRT